MGLFQALLLPCLAVDSAIAGVVGVVVGAVLTGGIQAIGAISSRRLESRVAARLLCMTLMETRRALQVVLKHQWWGPAEDDWTRLTAPWVDNREALARVLSPVDFLTVSLTFSNMERLLAIRADEMVTEDAVDNATRAEFAKGVSIVTEALNLVTEAGPILWKAGFPFWRRVGPSPFSPGGPRYQPEIFRPEPGEV